MKYEQKFNPSDGHSEFTKYYRNQFMSKHGWYRWKISGIEINISIILCSLIGIVGKFCQNFHFHVLKCKLLESGPNII